MLLLLSLLFKDKERYKKMYDDLASKINNFRSTDKFFLRSNDHVDNFYSDILMSIFVFVLNFQCNNNIVYGRIVSFPTFIFLW